MRGLAWLPLAMACTSPAPLQADTAGAGDGTTPADTAITPIDTAPVDSGTQTTPVDTSPPEDTGEPWDPDKPLELCINEFMPGNVTSLVNLDGSSPDWIELHNPGTEALDLGLWTMTDDLEDPEKHSMSGLLSVEAGGFLLLWADGEGGAGADHLNFKLSSEGGDLGIYAPDGRGSVIHYGEVEDDFSAGRTTDCCTEAGCWEFNFRGSPGYSNILDSAPATWFLTERSTWRYLDDDIGPSGDWTSADFDDSAWAYGAAPLGFGDSHIVTTVSATGAGGAPITTWFRTAFTVDSLDGLRVAAISLLVDDGAVVYLNGEEILRVNMAEGEVTSSTLASSAVGGSTETSYFDYDIDLGSLVVGENQLAVEVHEAAATSSDLGFDLGVQATP